MTRMFRSLGFPAMLVASGFAMTGPAPAQEQQPRQFHGHRPGTIGIFNDNTPHVIGRFNHNTQHVVPIYRGRHRVRGHGYYYGGRPYYRYGRYHHDNVGAAVAAGVIGAAIGAIASGAAHHSGGVAYCVRHFRSYNPRTGMYLGYDGRHHRCP
jgi:BA14K-like protein